MASERDLAERYARMLARDNDAEYGVVDPEIVQRERLRHRRTALFALGGITVATAIAAAAFVSGLAQPKPTHTEAAPSASPTYRETPSATESSASASPSASESSATPSASATKTTAPSSPTPTKTTSPSAMPSPIKSTHKIELPPIEPATSAPETQSSEPQSCAWEQSGSIVTVGECGDHIAYNDTQRNGEHPLGVGMQFEGPCLLDGLVEIHYGGGADYIENNGYFAVAGNC